MGLLATWGQYSTYVDAQGKYRVIWQWPDGGIEFYKFDAFKTEAELQTFFDALKLERDYSEYTKLDTFYDEDEALILSVVQYIRTHPALTLTQWNTLLGTKPWQDASKARHFVYRLAVKLSEHYGIVIDDWTEAQVMLKVRNWICTVDINILKKVVFGKFIEV